MIKTLKITTIIAAALAVVFLLLSVAFGLRTDPEKEQFLKLPGAIEQYKAGSAAEAGKADQVSPLMKQAKAFALRIQPPLPEKPVRPAKPAPRPSRVTPKFSLVGTSVYVFDPLRSLALIDEPGKGLRWVKPSDNVGHLVISQINDGNILVRDGERIETLYIKHPEKKSLLKNVPSVGPQGPQANSKPSRPMSRPQPSSGARTSPNAGKRPLTPKNQHKSMDIGPEEAKNLEKIGTIMKAIEEMENEFLRLERKRQSIKTTGPEEAKNLEKMETIQKAMEEMENELLRLERERQNPENASAANKVNHQ